MVETAQAPPDDHDDTHFVSRATASDIPIASIAMPQPPVVWSAELRPVFDQDADPIAIKRPETTIGRDAGSDVTLHDPTVSRLHARIIHSNNDYQIVDLDSRHGTFVNDVPVMSCLLHDGDKVQLGQSCFQFTRLFTRVD